MKKIRNKFLRFLGGVFFVLIFTINAYSWVMANGTENGFEEEYQELIEDDILLGASSYLVSYSDILNVFQRIEMAKLVPIEFDELKVLVDKAIFNMINARDAYISLNEKATQAAYDLKVINKLVVFDFEKFQVERGLNKEKFSEVSAFLHNGDVRGIYHKIQTDIETLLKNLYIIKNIIDSGNIPEVSILWNLNVLYSRTIIFGQNVAKVFYKVTGK